MSEEHDANCAQSERTENIVCTERTCECVVEDRDENEEACANDDSASNKSSGDKEVQQVHGRDRKGSILWTIEKSKLRVSWNLAEGTATSKDYVALCYTGKSLILANYDFKFRVFVPLT
ncbi:unnamed protein product [Euphydryas editha]|uniref:Uncharacterized protein n=1 Tax=Euphydryas editha TaxID=104508 RepID=A0AAU9TKP6_EUPED|nr:unnamed protein product [Euphydryas editha]